MVLPFLVKCILNIMYDFIYGGIKVHLFIKMKEVKYMIRKSSSSNAKSNLSYNYEIVLPTIWYMKIAL